jgi:hypothetical protein
MAHYAILDENNVVVNVIVGKDENDLEDGVTSWEEFYGDFFDATCKRTSYNTHQNQHIEGGTPFRGNYAGISYTYDQARDAFIPPQPFPSWTLDEATLTWEPPVPYPTDDGGPYQWDETNGVWSAQ